MRGRRSRWVPRALAALLALLGAPVPDAPAEDRPALKPPPSAAVLGQTLVLKSTQSSPSEELVAEYVPAAETLERWTLLLAVRVFRGKLTPVQAEQMKAQEVAARRAQGDVMANSQSYSKGGTRLIDFVLSESPIVEHNLMSFATLPDGRLVSYQLARRYYQNDPAGGVEDGLRTFMGEIVSRRDVYVKEVERQAAGLFAGATAPADAAGPAAAPAAGKKGKWTREEAVRELADFGYTPQARGSNKPIDGSSLVLAAGEGYDNVVELLLAAGVPVDAPLGSSQETALFRAVSHGYLDIAATLLDAGANANMKDENGDSPLIHLSKFCDEVALVRTFIKRGADVNATTRGGWTPLKEAVNQHCPAIARELRKAGARP
jgi:hypothetical protein